MMKFARVIRTFTTSSACWERMQRPLCASTRAARRECANQLAVLSCYPRFSSCSSALATGDKCTPGPIDTRNDEIAALRAQVQTLKCKVASLHIAVTEFRTVSAPMAFILCSKYWMKHHVLPKLHTDPHKLQKDLDVLYEVFHAPVETGFELPRFRPGRRVPPSLRLSWEKLDHCTFMMMMHKIQRNDIAPQLGIDAVRAAIEACPKHFWKVTPLVYDKLSEAAKDKLRLRSIKTLPQDEWVAISERLKPWRSGRQATENAIQFLTL
ncbi:hypothetical protein FN846DRAFT_887156 [Sphaerosporella brunnea]|uniref:Uncharacterized protein n=1 Tax=Sphaerosporella brunnea TaxID=1250544 RepID=A0A5J5F7E1_9PEZI|nr:hypothetical protein FN846DRAFT_887156 [Sphaerosporella brunnea]